MINELIKQAQDGNIEARNEIILLHSNVIDIVLAKLKHVRIDESTKRYGALMGILSAIERFNPDRGAFSYFCYLCALRKAQRHMTQDWLVRVPDAMMSHILSTGDVPYTTMTLSTLPDGYEPRSRNTDSNGNNFITQLSHGLTITDVLEDTDIKEIIKNSLNELNSLEKDVIYYKYGFIDGTLKEIGNKHGVSHEWVRIKTNETFKKLRKMVFKKLKIK